MGNLSAAPLYVLHVGHLLYAGPMEGLGTRGAERDRNVGTNTGLNSPGMKCSVQGSVSSLLTSCYSPTQAAACTPSRVKMEPEQCRGLPRSRLINARVEWGMWSADPQPQAPQCDNGGREAEQQAPRVPATGESVNAWQTQGSKIFPLCK